MRGCVDGVDLCSFLWGIFLILSIEVERVILHFGSATSWAKAWPEGRETSEQSNRMVAVNLGSLRWTEWDMASSFNGLLLWLGGTITWDCQINPFFCIILCCEYFTTATGKETNTPFIYCDILQVACFLIRAKDVSYFKHFGSGLFSLLGTVLFLFVLSFRLNTVRWWTVAEYLMMNTDVYKGR